MDPAFSGETNTLQYIYIYIHIHIYIYIYNIYIYNIYVYFVSTHAVKDMLCFLNQPESTTPVFDLHGTYPEH